MSLLKGRSILSLVLISIVGAAVLAYLVTRPLVPETGPIGLAERMSPAFIRANLSDTWRPLGLFILAAMAAIGLMLHWILAPLRELSKQASRIGPASPDARLSAGRAPAEIEPLIDAFNASLDRLEAALTAQRAFSANVAHELRTPLAALQAHVESLLPPEARIDATNEFQRLSRIIGQLLLLSEGEHSRLRFSERFDLVKIATAAAAEAAPEFVRSGRRIGVDCAVRELPRRGDPILVGLAIRNLLDNGLKHTPQGSTTTLSIHEDGVIRVSDDGPGVSACFAARAFEPFARDVRRTGTGGAGLGLSIVARIAELHGGRAWLEAAGRGARFAFCLPAPDPSEPAKG